MSISELESCSPRFEHPPQSGEVIVGLPFIFESEFVG